MVDNEYNIDCYKSANSSTGVVMGSLGMLKFVLDQLKTIKVCINAVKKFIICIVICYSSI